VKHTDVTTVLKEIQRGNLDILDLLPLEERRVVEEVLREINKDGGSRTLEALWHEDFERRPISMDQFLDDDYYLGQVGRSIYPLWRDELRYVHDSRRDIGEWILRGSIGSGKTTVAVLSLMYKIYYLTCLKQPQEYYGLAPRSPIVFGLFNIFKYLAKDTSYQYLTSWTKLSPYFQDTIRKAYTNERTVPGWLKRLNRMYGIDNEDLASSYLQFPKNITIALGSQAIHALGQNIFGGLLDEADMGKSRSMSDDERSQVADMYGQVRSRMDSRFMQAGGSNPGILMLVSQVRGKDSFLERHVKKVQNDPHSHITSFSLWQIKAHLFEGQATFKVVVGDQRTRSSILTSEQAERIHSELHIIEVPESLRARFEYDIDEAIRDLAGIATYGSDLFLPRRDKLFECYEHSGREHPFSVDEIELSIESDDTSTITDIFRKPVCMSQYDKATGAWRPKWFAGVERAIHVDLAQNKDCAGIAMGCIGAIKSVQRFDADERPYRTTDYEMFIDFALRIRAAQGSEIDFSKIRQFIFYLQHIGYPIKYISYDGWQSVDSMQIMHKAGFEVKLLSVDKKPIQYSYLKSTIMETRLNMYDYQPFTDEVTKLQDHTMLGTKPAIDHPPKGCFASDTKVSLMDGRERSLEELRIEYGSKQFWIYTVIGDAIAPALATVYVGPIKRMLAVTLDNGETIRATLDQLWMTRDSSYKRTSDLVAGDSLMPLYRRVTNGSTETLNGYEQLLHPRGSWEYTHRVSDRYNIQAGLDQAFVGTVRHHVNCDKRDNRPENIQRVTWEDHRELHSVLASERMDELWENPEFVRKVTETARRTMKQGWEPNGWLREARNPRSSRSDVTIDEIVIAASSATSWLQLAQYLACDPSVIYDRIKKAGILRSDFIAMFMPRYDPQAKNRARLCARNKTLEARILSSAWMTELNETSSQGGWGSRTHKHSRSRPCPESQRNHTVARVDVAGDYAEWCLQVPGSCNFALSAGVFVHNSKDVSDAICGVVARLLELKEHVSPGLDEEAIRARGQLLANQQKETPEEKIQDPRWLVGTFKKSNPLDAMFGIEPEDED